MLRITVEVCTSSHERVTWRRVSRARGAVVVLALIALLAGCGVAGRKEKAKQNPGGFLQPRTEGLLVPILEARYGEQKAGKEPAESSRALGKLLEDKSPETDEAAVVLLGYYLGEADNEDVMHDLTKRGKRVLPYLHRYRDQPASFRGKPYLDSIRVSESDRKEFFGTVIEAVEKGEVIGVD